MNTAEVARYLDVQPRKIYELVGKGEIPCSRVTGKWLFPKSLIDLWVLQGNIYPHPLPAAPPPPVIAGSHDPLLAWAAGESGCELALVLLDCAKFEYGIWIGVRDEVDETVAQVALSVEEKPCLDPTGWREEPRHDRHQQQRHCNRGEERSCGEMHPARSLSSLLCALPGLIIGVRPSRIGCLS